jgi:hypothetical protein
MANGKPGCYCASQLQPGGVGFRLLFVHYDQFITFPFMFQYLRKVFVGDELNSTANSEEFYCTYIHQSRQEQRKVW